MASLLFDTLAVRERSTERFESLHRRSQEIAVLQAAIFEYLGSIRTGLLSEDDSKRIQFLTEAVVNLESIASVVAKDFADIVRQAGDQQASERTREMIRGPYEPVLEALDLCVRAMRTSMPPIAPSR